jgi:hypothetical protein
MVANERRMIRKKYGCFDGQAKSKIGIQNLAMRG